MPNNRTFNDELAILNSQNFLGGLAEVGSAMKEGLQNKTLVQLFNEFQIEKQGLQTSGEQLSDFNKKYGENTDKEGFLTRGAPPQDKMSDDIKATVNLFGYLQKQEALLGTYEPFIQAFSVLGEDGIKVAKTLTDELANKMVMAQQEGEIPFKEMEYKSIVQQYEHNKDKIDDWHKRVDREWRLRNVQDAVLSSKLWSGLAKVRANFNTTAGKSAIKSYDETVKLIKQEMTTKFPDLNPDDIGIAVESMIAQYDKGMSLEEYEPKVIGGSGAGAGSYDPFTLDMSATFAEQFTAEFNSLGNDMKEALRIYQQDGYIPEKIVSPITGEPIKIDKDRVQELVNKANQFMKAQEILNYASGYQWFNKTEGDVSLGVDEEGNPQTTKMQLPTVKFREQGTGNIMRVRTLPDLFNMQFDYNPYQKQSILNKQKKGSENLQGQNSFEGTGRDFANEVVNFMYDDADMGLAVEAFENLIQSVYEPLSGKKLKTTKEIRKGRK